MNEIKNKIKELKNKKKEYFLDNSKYIFEYFENKKNISNEESNIVNNNKNNKSKILNQFFKISEIRDPINKQDNSNNNIVQKYLSNIDDMFLDINAYVYPTDICKFCHKGELVPLEDEGILMCNMCNRYVPYLIENEKPS